MNQISQAYKELLGENEFVYLDIGARGGPSKQLKKLFEDNVIKLILVELEETESSELKKKFIVWDKPLWKESADKEIYLTKNKSYSSLLSPNEKVLEGTFYYDRNFYKIEKIVKTKTTTINDMLNENKEIISQIDFMKIDIQGAEGYLLESFDDKIWEDLIGCETEAYTNELYNNCLTLDKLISKFYNYNFEIYNMKNISNMTMTSFKDTKIYNKDFFSARPKSRHYKGKHLVYDILFFKKIDQLFKKKDFVKLRKLIFILVIHGYYDFAFFILIKSKFEKIVSENDFSIINKNIKKIIHFKTPLLWRIKEKFFLRKYKLNKR